MFVSRESLLECSFRQSDVILRGIVRNYANNNCFSHACI